MGRIFLVSNTSCSILNFRLELIKALKSRGYRVAALAPEDESVLELKREAEHIPVKNLDRKSKNPIKEIKLFLEYLRVYKKEKPSLVINFTIKPNIYSSLACFMLGIPYISVITGLGYAFIKESPLTKLVSFLYRISLKRAQRVLFLNPEDMDVFLRKKIIKEDNKALMIYSEGVNTEHFSPDFCQGLEKPKTKVFLLVSRLLWSKGVGEFVEATRVLKGKGYKFESWILGPLDKENPDAINESQIKEWQEEGVIKYLGSTRDVRPYLCKASCVVLPSYYREGIPRCLLEAMAMEKPIITADAPGCREVCFDGVNGFLVKPGDALCLAAVMEKVLNLSDEERINMGKEGRRIAVERFKVDKVVDIYLREIEKIF